MTATHRPTVLAALLLLSLCATASAESPRSLVSKGNRDYKERKYPDALSAYEQAAQEKPESPQIWFNRGDALFRQGKFAEAAEAFEQAAVLSGDQSLEARSKFNQGNADFRLGVESAKSNSTQAIEQVERSVGHYRDALRTDPSLDDAKHNIEVARRYIEQLRQMQKQQKQQKQNDQSKDNKDQQNQDQQQQRQQQQQKEESDRQGQQEQPQQQKQQEQQQQAGEEKQQQQQQAAAENAKDILREEKDNKRRRQAVSVIGVKPVDKDW